LVAKLRGAHTLTAGARALTAERRRDATLADKNIAACRRDHATESARKCKNPAARPSTNKNDPLGRPLVRYFEVAATSDTDVIPAAPAKIGLYVTLVTNRLPGLWHAPRRTRSAFSSNC
jgi:hypothetical protein